MSEEKDVAVEETEVKKKSTKGKGKTKSKSKSKGSNIDVKKVIDETLSSVNGLFTASISKGLLILQVLFGLMLIAGFLGGFIGTLITVVGAVLGIVGARAIQSTLGEEPEAEGEEEDAE